MLTYNCQIFEPTYLYFLKAGNTVKIGISKNPEKRIKAIQTGNAQAVYLLGKICFHSRNDANLMEKAIHQSYSYLNRNAREWFHETDELIDFIESILKEAETKDEIFNLKVYK